MKRSAIVLMVAFFLAPSLSALAAGEYPIVFPVAGDNYYRDTWGAPRSGGRTHEGTDIMAAKMVPVVAASDGTVGWMNNVQGGNCCSMELIHDDGYRSRYIHLNNDTPGTDDGLGWGFAPGIETGVRVRAGQVIGYVGDSGNAENSGSHLHFELRDPSNVAFPSYPSLLVATPPDISQVSWYAGSLSDAGLAPIADPADIHVPSDSGFARVGDFDGDGSSEIAVGSPGDGWTVAEVGGSSQEWATWEGSPADVVTGDFDGDGDDDIGVFSVGGVWTGFRSNGSSFTEESWGRFGGYPWTERLVGDFDGDGDDDIISFHPPSRRWWISKLQGSTLVSSVYTTYGTANGWRVHLVADVDGDGSDELASFHPSNGTWWATNEGGSPRLIYDVSTNSGWQHLTAVDHDGDGVDELAMFHPSNGTWWVVDGSTTPARLSLWAQFNTRSGWVNPMGVDYDSDGLEDLVIRHEPSGRSWALIGGGGGQLSYLGTLVVGETEGEWIGSVGSNPALIAYTRS